MRSIGSVLLFFLALTFSASAQTLPKPAEGDYLVHNFHFRSGETLPELNLHYTTYGKPVTDANGYVTNAVMILHGTTGSGQQFTNPQFAGVLFGPGQLLDASRYFIILPDGIGMGHSSKPSDGLHAKFPHYDYEDMVEAQHLLLTEHLKVDHLRLLMGTSMGGMHTWLWAEQHPDFMDAAMPLASLPAEIAGRNRVWRRMILDSIRTSPDWNNGDYTQQPHGLTAALEVFLIMTSSPLQMQKEAPTPEQSDALLENYISTRLKTTDANDLLYAFDASRNYNPEPHLEKITVPLTVVNSADDVINPPELKILDQDIQRVKLGKYVLLPVTDATRGHSTHSLPAIWGDDLKELLERSGGR